VNGDIQLTTTRFKESDKATIYLINENPFKYKYKLNVSATAIGEGALSAFLPAIVPLMSEFVPKPPAPEKLTPAAVLASLEQTSPALTAEARTTSADTCLTAFERATETLRAPLDKALEKVLQGLNEAVRKQERNAAEYKSAKDLLETETLCESLRSVAQRILNLSNPVPDGLANDIDELSPLAAALKGAVQAFRSTNPDCLKIPAIDFAAKQYEQYAELVSTLVAPNAAQRLSSIQAAWKPIADARVKVEGVLRNPHAFWETRQVGPFDVPSVATVTATGEGATGDKGLNVTFKLQFGEPRFHLSAGIAVSNIDPREYQRVQSPKSDGTVETLVGRKDSGNFRILPMVLLHGRFWDVNKAPIYATVGITAKNDNKGTTPEYLVGASLPLIRNLMFVTAGAYVGRQQVLQGGLYEGAVVPEKIAELPVSKPYTCGFGFAVSFKFR
jgi:hypothetical protein